jgi:peptidoglycan/xylan/chitin deacetylase (PgdA/CDA1 family)
MLFRQFCLALILISFSLVALAFPQAREVHDKIAPNKNGQKQVALTLDACSGAYDEDLVQFLIRNRIPATLFVTKRWLVSNPYAVSVLKANLDLFEIEDHGEKHIPPVIGRGRKIYGIAGQPDLLHLQREVLEGARAIEQIIGVHPKWYRGATAMYDPQAIEKIKEMGFEIAGFSVNADAGATLPQKQIEQRLAKVKSGDVIIAHMNKPQGFSAEALSVGLLQLLRQGFVFVRLNDVKLIEN